MGESDKQPLLLLPEDSNSDSKNETKGKTKLNADVHVPVGSAASRFSETANRDDLEKLWIPDPLFVSDDRVRRDGLWGSALGLATRDENMETTRDCKRVAEIEATVEHPLSQYDRDLHGDSHALLQHDAALTNGIQKFEIERPSERPRSDIKEWVRKSDQERNSQAEWFSELLKLKPASMNSEAESIAGERELSSDRKREKRVSQLTRPSLQRQSSFAMQVSERMPPEWVLLLLGTPYTRIGLGRNAPRGSGLVACTKACGHLA